jgi:hypothetical protein
MRTETITALLVAVGMALIALLALSQMSHGQLVVSSTTAECGTSNDGSVVGVPNPAFPPAVNVGYTGTLPPNNYFVEIAWYDAAAHVTLISPEVQVQLTGSGQIQVLPPQNGMPANAAGSQVFIGTSSGGETLQGSTTGSATFVQSGPLASGAAPPTANTTLCQVIANDSGWPTGTGYNVTITNPSGNTVPGYPMQWQLLGPGLTLNLSQGLPLYNGTVTYPIPILARPYNHAPQSINGPLNLQNYNLTAGAAQFSGLVQLLDGGVFAGSFSGTPTFSYINFTTGIQFQGSFGTAGNCVVSTGSGAGWSSSCGVGGAPTITAGFAAGTGPSLSLLTGSADKAGRISLTTGTSPTVDVLLTVTFSTPFSTASFCTVSPGDPTASAALSNIYVNSGTGSFQIYTTGSPLAAGTGYQWNYVCNGH